MNSTTAAMENPHWREMVRWASTESARNPFANYNTGHNAFGPIWPDSNDMFSVQMTRGRPDESYSVWGNGLSPAQQAQFQRCVAATNAPYKCATAIFPQNARDGRCSSYNYLN